jgi:hypothetical protein
MSEANARTQVEQIDAQLRAVGAQGMSDVEKAQLAGRLQNAQINEQASATNASLQAQKSMLQANLAQQAKQFGGTMALNANQGLLGVGQGLTSLYGTGDTNVNTILGLQNGLINSQAGANQNILSDRLAATQIPSDFGQALGYAGSIIGMLPKVGGMLNGLTGLGGQTTQTASQTPAGTANVGSYNPAGYLTSGGNTGSTGNFTGWASGGINAGGQTVMGPNGETIQTGSALPTGAYGNTGAYNPYGQITDPLQNPNYFQNSSLYGGG